MIEPMQLLCPKCRSSMQWITQGPLKCSGCAALYPVKDGIPTIRNNQDYYHGLLPRDRMLEMLERSRSMGWEAAFAHQIRQEPDHRKEALRDVLLNESRAAFKIVLDGLAGKRVLDLGCGSGSTSINLARWAQLVVGCDLTWERVAFLSMRAKALGLDNLHTLCGGDTRPLPFLDGSFDCVILNGVLEWSAAEGTRPVRAAQREFLEEIRRILRPDGQLYIGIENRLGFYYFLGQPEDHTGVKYAALAPRWLADVMVHRSRGHPYRTYTYSRSGCQKLLREAGYRSTRFYAPVPDYRRFHEIVALDSPTQSDDDQPNGMRARLKQWLLRSRWFTPSFGIVTSPGSAKEPWINNLASHVRDRLGIAGDHGFPRIRLTATSSAGVIAFLGRSAIIRVPLDPVNDVRVRCNFEGLQRAKALSAVLPDFAAPSPLLSDTFQGVPYTVESHLDGRGYKSLRPQEYEVADRKVFDFLLRFKTLPTAATPAAPAGQVWQSLVIVAMRQLVERLPDERMRDQVRRLLALVEKCDGEMLPVGFGHGDFWWGNVLLDGPDGRVGLVDWDGWSSSNFATNDFLHFTCYRRVLRKGLAWERAFTDWLESRNVDSLEAEWTERLAAALKLPPRWKALAGAAYWVREVTAHDESKLQFDQIWTEKIVGSVLPSLINSMSGSGKG